MRAAPGGSDCAFDAQLRRRPRRSYTVYEGIIRGGRCCETEQTRSGAPFPYSRTRTDGAARSSCHLHLASRVLFTLCAHLAYKEKLICRSARERRPSAICILLLAAFESGLWCEIILYFLAGRLSRAPAARPKGSAWGRNRSLDWIAIDPNGFEVRSCSRALPATRRTRHCRRSKSLVTIRSISGSNFERTHAHKRASNCRDESDRIGSNRFRSDAQANSDAELVRSDLCQIGSSLRPYPIRLTAPRRGQSSGDYQHNYSIIRSSKAAPLIVALTCRARRPLMDVERRRGARRTQHGAIKKQISLGGSLSFLEEERGSDPLRLDHD